MSGLVWSMPLATAVAAPTLGAAPLDVADAAGGGSVTWPGTNLTGATITVGGTAATVTATTATSVTFTMPAKSPGLYAVQATTSGGPSNAVSLYVESSPLFWLDASRASVASSKVIGIPNTAQAPFDLSVSQATTASQPAYSSAHASFNAQPAITFDGVDDQLLSGMLATATSGALTFYFVARWDNFGNLFLLDDVDGNSRISFYDNGGALAVFSSPASNMNGGVGVSAVNVWCVVLNVSGATSAIYQNNAATAAYSGTDIALEALKSLRIGARFNSASFFNGVFGTMAAFGGVHDATTRAREMGRLKAKYGTP